MNPAHDPIVPVNGLHTRPVSQFRQAAATAVAAILAILWWGSAIGQTSQPDDAFPGAQVLTRGPVHEAFAGIVLFNPEPGVAVANVPPDAVEEMPPEEKPEGDNVTWIPGYWAWDDERTDFLWISGTWRALPPGRAWMPGYWSQTPKGYQWTSGYWAEATARQTTYLPAPPVTLEAGPNVAAPTVDYGWSPGCWIWYRERYAWRPGHWVQGQANWDWSPSHYVWTPHGFIFVGGFWDYPVARRGVLFAPVYFEVGRSHGSPSYSYTPRIVIHLGVFAAHLFLRPSYHHYYFGDYYAANYAQTGFYAAFSFASGHRGYDPIYAHQHWEHRQDRGWEDRVRASYKDRRDHESARPPRTWAEQQNLRPSPSDSGPARNVPVAMPIRQLAARRDNLVKFQPVATAERQRLVQRVHEVQQARETRRTLEARGGNTAGPVSTERIEPARVQLPRSPIVARPPGSAGRNQTPPPAPRTPKSEPRVRPPNAVQTTDRPASPPAEAITRPTGGRVYQSPRARQAQPAPLPRAKEKEAAPRGKQSSVETKPTPLMNGAQEPSNNGRQ